MLRGKKTQTLNLANNFITKMKNPESYLLLTKPGVLVTKCQSATIS